MNNVNILSLNFRSICSVSKQGRLLALIEEHNVGITVNHTMTNHSILKYYFLLISQFIGKIDQLVVVVFFCVLVILQIL